jgi:hypothetical protein
VFTKPLPSNGHIRHSAFMLSASQLVLHIPPISYFDLNVLIISEEKYKQQASSLCNFIRPSFAFSFSSSKQFVLKRPQFASFVGKDQVSRPYKKQRRNLLFNFVLLMYLV